MNKLKDSSPLVEAVLTLDTYFSDLQRISAKIETMDLKSDFDFEQTQKLLNRFTECGQGISEQVVLMSNALNEARAQAEVCAQIVATRADEMQARQDGRQKKMIEFQQLGEKVKNLTLSLNDLKRPEGVAPTDEDRAKISMRLSEVELQLQPLIDEAHSLKIEAQETRMKALEQGAESMRQSLLVIRQKLSSFQQTQDTLQ